MYMNNDIYLSHYGIKGMKWGVRRTPEQLGHRPTIKMAGNKEAVSDKALNSRIDKLRNWETFENEDDIKQYARDICKDIVTTRKPIDHHKFLSRISNILDGDVHDDPSIMSVNKKTGYMRYNSCVKFDLNNVHRNDSTGLYNTRDLDKALGHKSGSTYYYCWGELQNQD